MNGGDRINRRPVVRRSPYAVLNCRRGCRDDEVRDSYKRLSRLLHPDKRPPGREREDAQELFTELRNACEFIAVSFRVDVCQSPPSCDLMHALRNDFR